jgi:hypothetical protein
MSFPAILFASGQAEPYLGTSDGFISLRDGAKQRCQPQLHITWQFRNNAWHVPEGCLLIDPYPIAPPVPLDRTMEDRPKIGDVGTIWLAPIKRAAVVTSVTDGGNVVSVRTDYDLRPRIFRVQEDGLLRESATDSQILILHVQMTNYVQFKQWYSKKNLIAGPVAGPDIRNYLPSNWETYYKD